MGHQSQKHLGLVKQNTTSCSQCWPKMICTYVYIWRVILIQCCGDHYWKEVTTQNGSGPWPTSTSLSLSMPFILHMSAPLGQQATWGLSQTIRQWGCNEIQQHTAPPAPDNRWDISNWVNEACICGIPPFQVVLHFCPTRPTKTFLQLATCMLFWCVLQPNHFGTMELSLWTNNHHWPLVRQVISLATLTKHPRPKGLDSNFYRDPSHPSIWAKRPISNNWDCGTTAIRSYCPLSKPDVLCATSQNTCIAKA